MTSFMFLYHKAGLNKILMKRLLVLLALGFVSVSCGIAPARNLDARKRGVSSRLLQRSLSNGVYIHDAQPLRARTRSQAHDHQQ